MRNEAFVPVRPEMKGEKCNWCGTSKSLIGKDCLLAIARYQLLNPFSSLGGKIWYMFGIGRKEFGEELFYAFASVPDTTPRRSQEHQHRQKYYPVITRLVPVLVTVYCFRAELAGPFFTAPVSVNSEPCAVQRKISVVAAYSTVTPWWVQYCETAI